MSGAVQDYEEIREQLSGNASRLPIVELPKGDVEGHRKSIRYRRGSQKRAEADSSFGDFNGSLSFTEWQFYHAVKKTELITSFTTEYIDGRAAGFSNDYKGLFVWNTQNLRRTNRSVFALEDFATSSIAGRCGEAISYLTMAKWGYAFWDRIAVLWERAASNSGMTHPEMVQAAEVIASKLSARPALQADFAFEKRTREVAIMESKGSFVHPVRDDPSTKDDLRYGLKQVAAWSDMISPPPHKSFVIGAYLRDASDISGDPSLIAFVDPVGGNNGSGQLVELPPDWIRRGNYGAWLMGMGFSATGDALRNGRGVSPPDQPLPVLRLQDRAYVVTFQGMIIKRSRAMDRRFVLPWWEPWFPPHEFWRHPDIARDAGIVGIRVMGIEIGVMDAIQAAVLNATSSSLMDIDVAETLPEAMNVEGFSGSIMPDQSLLGVIEPELLANTGTRAYRL